MDEFFPFDVNHYLLVDTIEGMESDLNENMIKVYYDDETQTVSEQYKSALDMIETKYIIHDMEDFVLLDKPQEDKLLDCIDFVIDNDTEYEEYTLDNSERSLEPLRAKVLNNLIKLQENNDIMVLNYDSVHDKIHKENK